MTETNTLRNKTVSNEQQLVQANKGFVLSRREFIEIAGAVGAIAGLAVVAPKISFAQIGNTTAISPTTPNSLTGVPGEQIIPSTCNVCTSADMILIHVVNGQPMYIEGNPNDAKTRGHVCARAMSAIWKHYDPYRVKTYMKRTNPKGMYNTGGWVEITQAEAFSAIKTAYQTAVAKGSSGYVYIASGLPAPYGWNWLSSVDEASFINALQGPCTNISIMMDFCGMVGHRLGLMSHGAFLSNPDYERCNYLIEWGWCHGRQGMLIAQDAAIMSDARARGMKIVHLNPYMGTAAATANQWIPIAPHTDGAFADAMLEVMLVELKQYDASFLKTYTNGPYLIGPDGLYVRDTATNKPLIWDPVDNKAKTYNDTSIKDYALLGSFTVNGVTASPGFQMLVNSVTTMTPEWAEPITTVPAATIRQVATDFLNAAQIGASIAINGVTYPYRPSATSMPMSSTVNYEHSMANSKSCELVNFVIGNVDVPGGHCSVKAVMDFEQNVPGPDGMLCWPNGQLPTYGPVTNISQIAARISKWPPTDPALSELFPFNSKVADTTMISMTNPTQYWGAGNKTVDFAFLYALNPALTMYDAPKMNTVFSNFKFMASTCLWINETADAFADIVIPDACSLEEYGYTGPDTHGLNAKLCLPACDPPAGIQHLHDMLTALASQLGILKAYNTILLSPLTAPNTFDVTQPISVEDYMNLVCQSVWNQPLSYMMQNPNSFSEGITYDAGIDPYLPWAHAGRLPLYWEQELEVKNLLQSNLATNGVTLQNEDGTPWDFNDFAAVPTWTPSIDQKDTSPYNLILLPYAIPYYTVQNPTPTSIEIASTMPDAFPLAINTATAKSLGISEGDTVTIESEIGKLNAVAHLTEGIHPSAVAVSRANQGWGTNSLVKDLYKNNRMISFQTIRPDKLSLIDKEAGALEIHIKVRVYKAT
jgi:anaerobic selenocysteine-containing dehydrogenase